MFYKKIEQLYLKEIAKGINFEKNIPPILLNARSLWPLKIYSIYFFLRMQAYEKIKIFLTEVRERDLFFYGWSCAALLMLLIGKLLYINIIIKLFLIIIFTLIFYKNKKKIIFKIKNYVSIFLFKICGVYFNGFYYVRNEEQINDDRTFLKKEIRQDTVSDYANREESNIYIFKNKTYLYMAFDFHHDIIAPLFFKFFTFLTFIRLMLYYFPFFYPLCYFIVLITLVIFNLNNYFFIFSIIFIISKILFFRLDNNMDEVFTYLVAYDKEITNENFVFSLYNIRIIAAWSLRSVYRVELKYLTFKEWADLQYTDASYFRIEAACAWSLYKTLFLDSCLRPLENPIKLTKNDKKSNIR